ncbi:MAG: sulfatase [Elusimicrobiota bacterium]|jgi:arylsulfatase A-like enzyme
MNFSPIRANIRRRAAVSAAAFLGFLTAVGLRAAEPGAPLCKDCNVVLISLDALQAAHVHSLGCARNTTPNFDRLAARGTLFTQAVSPASWTLPASMSWFTGLEPTLHGVVNKFTTFSSEKAVISHVRDTALPGTRTLGEVFSAAGYAAAGFTGDAGVNGIFGFKEGFEVYSDSVPPFSGLARSVPPAAQWLRKNKDRRFFLFLHGYDVHGQAFPEGGLDNRFVPKDYAGPFTGSPAQQRQLRERGLAQGSLGLSAQDVDFWRAAYDEKAQRMDERLGEFLRVLEETGVSSRTIIVALSDHGTELLEHGRLDHGFTLYDELVRVPLAIVCPGTAPRKLVREQVGTLALFSTLLDLTGVRPASLPKEQLSEPSLAPLLTGEGAGRDVYMETDYRLFARKRGLRTSDGWKFVRGFDDGSRELYDLNKDPGETVDLFSREPERARELEARLLAHYRRLGADLEKRAWTPGCLPVYGDQCR